MTEPGSNQAMETTTPYIVMTTSYLTLSQTLRIYLAIPTENQVCETDSSDIKTDNIWRVGKQV